MHHTDFGPSFAVSSHLSYSILIHLIHPSTCFIFFISWSKILLSILNINNISTINYKIHIWNAREGRMPEPSSSNNHTMEKNMTKGE